MGDTQRFLIFDRQGIQTDLFAIERYVDEILEEVLSNREEFQRSIQIPLISDSNKMLNTLQNSEIGSYEHFQENFPQVLQLNMYLTLEKEGRNSGTSRKEDMRALWSESVSTSTTRSSSTASTTPSSSSNPMERKGHHSPGPEPLSDSNPLRTLPLKRCSRS